MFMITKILKKYYLLLLKQKGILNEIYNQRIKELDELNSKIDLTNLI